MNERAYALLTMCSVWMDYSEVLTKVRMISGVHENLSSLHQCIYRFFEE